MNIQIGAVLGGLLIVVLTCTCRGGDAGTPTANTICKDNAIYELDSRGQQIRKRGSCSCGCDTSGARCKAPCGKKGLTWIKEGHVGDADRVGCNNNSCNPYQGDTDCTEKRPLLCIKQDGSTSKHFPPPWHRYNGWAFGKIALTEPVRGTDLLSVEVADGMCATRFGSGWRMAEFHDSWYCESMQGCEYGSHTMRRAGWNWRAIGDIAADTRFWLRINDQSGNCWD